MSKDTTAGTPAGGAVTLDAWVREALRCPVTGATLVDGTGPDGSPELHSTDAERPLAYPVRDGIPVLLEGDARAL
ncbi:Trm112 family protein [Oerskovia enterophila]|uniref:Uncharacterized protein n=1 Tax=Oerskovia enterophila TaxID=43678 RepID=A0A161YDW2_9CELL|nr:hypothetical protein [Oerskovia enterophila]KZM33928.1 hypothetical protein OJAG_34120 [Oerskovia enterophila]OCI32590.1 hypothetical protein OERS_07740 [Oerskovia enterophila]